jgi:hypothetical protein
LSLRALLMPQDGGEPEPALKNLLRDESRTAGKWLYTDVLHDRSACNVIGQTPGKLVIVGKRIVDELVLPINVISEPDRERCMIVVQGGKLQDGSGSS